MRRDAFKACKLPIAGRSDENGGRVEPCMYKARIMQEAQGSRNGEKTPENSVGVCILSVGENCGERSSGLCGDVHSAVRAFDRREVLENVRVTKGFETGKSRFDEGL